MQRLSNSPVQFQFGVRGWAAVAVGLAMFAALAFLAIGFFIVILPLVLLAPILFWILPKPHRAPPQKPPATQGAVIEGEFKVIAGKSDSAGNGGDGRHEPA